MIFNMANGILTAILKFDNFPALKKFVQVESYMYFLTPHYTAGFQKHKLYKTPE